MEVISRAVLNFESTWEHSHILTAISNFRAKTHLLVELAEIGKTDRITSQGQAKQYQVTIYEAVPNEIFLLGRMIQNKVFPEILNRLP